MSSVEPYVKINTNVITLPQSMVPYFNQSAWDILRIRKFKSIFRTPVSMAAH